MCSSTREAKRSFQPANARKTSKNVRNSPCASRPHTPEIEAIRTAWQRNDSSRLAQRRRHLVLDFLAEQRAGKLDVLRMATANATRRVDDSATGRQKTVVSNLSQTRSHRVAAPGGVGGPAHPDTELFFRKIRLCRWRRVFAALASYFLQAIRDRDVRRALPASSPGRTETAVGGERSIRAPPRSQPPIAVLRPGEPGDLSHASTAANANIVSPRRRPLTASRDRVRHRRVVTLAPHWKCHNAFSALFPSKRDNSPPARKHNPPAWTARLTMW